MFRALRDYFFGSGATNETEIDNGAFTTLVPENSTQPETKKKLVGSEFRKYNLRKRTQQFDYSDSKKNKQLNYGKYKKKRTVSKQKAIISKSQDSDTEKEDFSKDFVAMESTNDKKDDNAEPAEASVSYGETKQCLPQQS